MDGFRISKLPILATDESGMSGKTGLPIGDISELLQQLGAMVWESSGGKWFVTYVSHDTEKALGFRDNEWNPDLTAWVDLLHPEDRERVGNLIAKAMSGEEAVVFDDRVRTANGGWMWLRNIVRIESGMTGAPIDE